MNRAKIGIVGLGRLGIKHAENLKYRVPGCDLHAACSLDEKEREYAKSELKIEQVYDDYTRFVNESDCDGIFIASSTSAHADHIVKALEARKHVFCEKPVGLTMDEGLRVKKVAEKYPEQSLLIRYVRRFDPHYQEAKRKIDAGEIGTPYMVRAQTVDMDHTVPFQINYVSQSGGAFLGMNAHDIDLARWFLGAEVRTAFSIGGAFKHPQFGDLKDADNVTTLCQLDEKKMAVIIGSRIAQHGHDNFTEIMGTEGSLIVGATPNKDRIEIKDKHGVRTECVQDFYERFSEAFLQEAIHFVDCVQTGKKPLVGIDDAIKITEAAIAFTESFHSNELVRID